MKNAMMFLVGFASLNLMSLGCQLGEDAWVTADVEVPEPSQPAGDAVRESLERAHRAYAVGDHRKMIQELGAVLADPEADDAARANAIELLDAAVVDSKGMIDSGFERPAGTTWMRLIFQQADRDGTPAYSAMLNGGLEPGVEVDELRIVDERSGRVLASRSSKIGYFKTGEEGGKPYFYIHTNDASAPMPAGAYRIDWTFADGSSGSSRVVVPTLRLTDLPRLTEPSSGETTGTQPTLRWQPPSWVSEVSFGKVHFEVRIESKLGSSAQRWSTWSNDKNITQATVGDGGEPPGAHLDAGATYDGAVQYQWRLEYGELQLGSAARTQRRFTVESR